jgi:hypothetical protein
MNSARLWKIFIDCCGRFAAFSLVSSIYLFILPAQRHNYKLHWRTIPDRWHQKPPTALKSPASALNIDGLSMLAASHSPEALKYLMDCVCAKSWMSSASCKDFDGFCFSFPANPQFQSFNFAILFRKTAEL